MATSASAARSSRAPTAELVPSAERGSLEAALELLDGLVPVLANEADETDDELVGTTLVMLPADVLDAIDTLADEV